MDSRRPAATEKKPLTARPATRGNIPRTLSTSTKFCRRQCGPSSVSTEALRSKLKENISACGEADAFVRPAAARTSGIELRRSYPDECVPGSILAKLWRLSCLHDAWDRLQVRLDLNVIPVLQQTAYFHGDCAADLHHQPTPRF